ncbi:MAG TPA: GeoRSP system SPASM domain protein [Thermodesulfovibrionales bacterium]|nr:GeoRSP system SPASM domain protein [Thermodesulfovibrionales bacterium]
MNLKELSFPLRIYWDLKPEPDKPTLNITQICKGIAEVKALSLSLLDAGAQLSDSCIEILEKVKDQDISVDLTVSHSSLNPSITEFLSRLKVNELLIDASTDDDLRSLVEIVRWNKDGNMSLGVSFNADGGNYRSIPAVVSFCRGNDITRLAFPMQRLTEKGDCFYIGREEGRALALKLSELNIDNMKLTIHDPFLWRVFYPGIAFPGCGCQAANTMAHISSDGDVYPCPSMPFVLGDPRKETLKTILSSAHKKSLRKGLIVPPEECLGCGELDQCMGGCRGRTFALSGSFDRRDPACF